MDGLRAIFKEHSLNIEVTGIHAVPIISIKESNPLVIKTFFTQEMLKRGYLAGTVIYLSLAHTRDVIRLYLEEAAKVFKEIRAEINGGGLEKRLEGPVCHSGFARLS